MLEDSNIDTTHLLWIKHTAAAYTIDVDGLEDSGPTRTPRDAPTVARLTVSPIIGSWSVMLLAKGNGGGVPKRASFSFARRTRAAPGGASSPTD